jgi:hypothetical protein
MKKKIICALVLVAAILVTAYGTYRYTMLHLSIETDGDGDSAIVTVYGQSDLYGTNGYKVG